MYGFQGRLLHIDLTKKTHNWLSLEESRLRAVLGGIGLGVSLLHDFAPQGVEPLSPDNPLILASAPLVGTELTSTAKYAVVTKSPLTGFIADSLSSSFFALELKRAGLDALVITGRASSLVYVFIENEKVEVSEYSDEIGIDSEAKWHLIRRKAAVREVGAKRRWEFVHSLRVVLVASQLIISWFF